jgi:transcriptional antiterminator NusG
MASEQLNISWYVLHTKSRFENVLNDALKKKSIEVFLPKIQVKSKRRDRNIMISVPLFPGYIFVQTNLKPDHRIEILKTSGAVRLIGNNEGPISVPSKTIDSLKIMVQADHPVKTGNKFIKGDTVIVVNGPFTGITGIFERYRGLSHVVVNIEALGQFASVDVNEEDIEKLPKIFS